MSLSCVFLILINILVVVWAGCPNLCSGRGNCDSENTCICLTGFDGSPDCSLSKSRLYCIFRMFHNNHGLESCPTGVSWDGKAQGLNTAHRTAECSNRGTCDRYTVGLRILLKKEFNLVAIGKLCLH